MPSKYLTRALDALAQMYRFPGQTAAPPGFELELPIQVVHDVSREAEIRTMQRGTTAIPVIIPAMSTTVFAEVAALGLFNLVRTLNPTGPNWDFEDCEIWLERISAEADTPNNVSLLQASITELGGRDCFIARWINTGAVAMTAAGETPLVNASVVPPQAAADPMPMRIDNGGGIRLRGGSNANGAVTMTVTVNLMVVPRGVLPPS